MKKNLLFGLTGCLLLTIWYTWSLILHLDQPLSLAHGDAHQTSFVLNHYIQIFKSANWSGWGTLPMFYGLPNSLFFTEGFFLQSPVAIFLSFFTSNIFLISNFIAVITVFISLISAFIYFDYIIKNRLAALAASLVFVCNPYVSARFPDHLLLINLQYIPLILLTIELYIVKRSTRWLWLFAILSLFQLYGSSIYYTVYLTVFIPIYVIIRSWPYLSFRAPKYIVARNLIVFSPFIFLLLGSIPFITFYRTIGLELSLDRTLDQIAMGYSARVSDWFFMWQGSWLYGGWKNIAATWWQQVVRLGIPSEHNLFPGLFTAIAAALAFFIIVRQSRQQVGWLFLFIIIVAWWLSLGPDVVITDNLKFPGLYRLFYYLHPLAKYLRVSSRFAAFVYLGLGYLVGFTIVMLRSGVISTRQPAGRNLVNYSRKLLSTVILLGIIFEFSVKPLEFLQVDYETKSAYHMLDQNQEIRVIVDWPMNNRIPQFMPFARSQELDSHYLLWASGFHSKSLLNGYTGHIPEAYFRRAALIATQFPAPSSLNLLKDWGVDAIVLHKNEYANSYDYTSVKKSLTQLNLPIIAESNTITIFDLKYSQ